MRKRTGKSLFSIFMTFLKMGPFTFGGGYALIPVIEREIVEKRGWLQAREIADLTAVAGTVPGAIAANTATIIGYRIAGVRGAVSALLGIFLPTFAIMIGMGFLYAGLKDNPKVEAAFLSIRATVVALIVYAAVKIGKTAIVDFATGSLAAISVALLLFGSGFVHPLWLIVFGAVAGIAVVKVRERFGKKTKPMDDEQEQVFDYMI